MVENIMLFNGFCYFGHVISCSNINKHGPKINHKTALKSTPQLGSILEPTWLHFGRVWGSKMGPSWTKSLQKSIFKSIKKLSLSESLLGPIFIDFGLQNRPQEGAPEITFRHFFSSWSHLGPKIPQDLPKSPQDPPQEHPGLPNTSILEDFAPQLDGFWHRFGGCWHPTAKQLISN